MSVGPPVRLGNQLALFSVLRHCKEAGGTYNFPVFPGAAKGMNAPGFCQ